MEEKPFYKKWWFILLAVMIVASLSSLAFGDDEDEVEADEPKTEEVAETDDVVEEDVDEDVKDDNEIPQEIKDLNITDVREDVTGNWKKAVDSKNFNMPENAMAYYGEYMEDEEIHYLVSFATNTTTSISSVGNDLEVNIYEYVKKEEHSAKTLGSGMLLKTYHINKDTGEIGDIY